MAQPETRTLAAAADVVAPDGCEVRLLPVSGRGSMAHFTLGPNQTSHAIEHRTIEEIWFFLGGEGRIWRWWEGGEETVAVRAEVAITIPLGTRFQLRNDGAEPLRAVAIAMPPWPGNDEAVFVEGAWPATVGD